MSKYSLRDNGSACRFFDGEAVLINAETSAYYSMNRTGTFLLQELLVSGREPGEITRTFEDRFGTATADIDSDVREAITELESEGLIILTVDGSTAPAVETDEDCSLPDAYTKPVLERHGNLEQLILSGE